MLWITHKQPFTSYQNLKYFSYWSWYLNLFVNYILPEVIAILSVIIMNMLCMFSEFYTMLMLCLSSSGGNISYNHISLPQIIWNLMQKCSLTIDFLFSATSTGFDPFKPLRGSYKDDLSFQRTCSFYAREFFLNLPWPLEVIKHLSAICIEVSSFF